MEVMGEEMDLSVVIAAYNADAYLQQCLESVRACPGRSMECIVINDGSTDQTRRIAEEFADGDSRFRVVNQSNAGVSDSRNTGMSLARGAYLLFLDADDAINTDLWPRLLEQAREARYDMVAYGYYSLFASGRMEEERFPPYADAPETTMAHVRHALLATTLLNTCWGKLLRRSLIEEGNIRFRSELKTCEDAIFVVDFVEQAKTFRLVNQPLLYYRIHEGSAMRRRDIHDKLRDFTQLLDRRSAYLQCNPDAEAARLLYRESFSIVTDLFRSCAGSSSLGEAEVVFQTCLEQLVVEEILSHLEPATLSPFYKRLEYTWMKQRRYGLLAVYFKWKSMFIKS